MPETTFERPAMDVTNAETQATIADSLLGDPEPAEQTAEEQGGQFEEFDRSQDHFSSDETDRAGEFFEEAPQGRQAAQPEHTQQQAETAPQSIQESVAALDAVVQEHSLNDAALAKDFAAGFCEAFGTDLYTAGANVEGLGNVMAKTALSAAQLYDSVGGDLSKVPGEIHPESAKVFTYDFLRAWGVDPRTTQVNEQLLTGTVLQGVLNFYATYQARGGKVTSVDQLNSPEMAEQFLGNFLRAFGVEGQVDRGMALRFADAGGKYLLGFLGKLSAIQPQPARPQSQRSRASAPRSSVQQRSSGRAPSKGSGRSTRFRTNGDIFTDDVMDFWQQNHGRM
jgi:hypothetical protein